MPPNAAIQLTATTYTFGGIMREQVCTYMCPWPRIQAAMLDEDSLTVTYNDWRGEPRHSGKKKAAAAGQVVGDCVDCNACVAVCPMGIDIRDGQQLECITCALCIDACDSVMDKLGKPRGLISYATLDDYQQNMELSKGGNPAGKINPKNVYTAEGKLVDSVRHFRISHLFRARTLMYIGVWSTIGIAIVVSLLSRDRLELNVLHDRNPQFVQLSDGSIRNGYTVKLLNMIPEERTILLTIDGIPGAMMSAIGYEDQPKGKALAIKVAPDKTLAIKVFVEVPPVAIDDEEMDFHFKANDMAGTETDRYDATFNAPEIHK